MPIPRVYFGVKRRGFSWRVSLQSRHMRNSESCLWSRWGGIRQRGCHAGLRLIALDWRGVDFCLWGLEMDMLLQWFGCMWRMAMMMVFKNSWDETGGKGSNTATFVRFDTRIARNSIGYYSMHCELFKFQIWHRHILWIAGYCRLNVISTQLPGRRVTRRSVQATFLGIMPRSEVMQAQHSMTLEIRNKNTTPCSFLGITLGSLVAIKTMITTTRDFDGGVQQLMDFKMSSCILVTNYAPHQLGTGQALISSVHKWRIHNISPYSVLDNPCLSWHPPF